MASASDSQPQPQEWREFHIHHHPTTVASRSNDDDPNGDDDNGTRIIVNHPISSNEVDEDDVVYASGMNLFGNLQEEEEEETMNFSINVEDDDGEDVGATETSC